MSKEIQQSVKVEIKKREEEEKVRIRAARKIYAEKLKDTVRCRVQNIEDQNAPEVPPISFNVNGFDFEYEHGLEYDIPKVIVNHLNSLKTPVYGYAKDPNDQHPNAQEKSMVVGWKQRFSVQPVSL